MATPADSLRLAIVKEDTQGVTPVTPTPQIVRTTGEGLSYEVTTTVSDEISSLSRGITDNILTGATVTGDINFELSNNAGFEMMIESVLASMWANDPQETGALYPTALGAAGAVYDSDDMSTFTIEKRFASVSLSDGSETTLYQLFTGCSVDTLNLSITPNEIITGSFGFLGMQMDTPSAPLAVDGSYLDAGLSPVMSAPLVTGIELLLHTADGSEGGEVAWLTDSCFTGCEITVTNNGRGLVCIGTLGNKATALGRFEASISGTLYYTGDDPLESLVNQTEYQFRVTCADSAGETYMFFFPRVKFSAANALASGTNTDVMVEFTLQPLMDAFQKYTMLVERSPATLLSTARTRKPSPNELGAKDDKD